MTTNLNADIKFKDGTKVKRKPEVTYLGCQINQYSNITQEISKRIACCMTILKRLDIFWRHCDVKNAFKINTLDAVIRSKLLYGIDSAQLTTSNQRRIEVFQLKGLRKTLKMTTTYVDRHNSNAEVFRRANELIKKMKRKKENTKHCQTICNMLSKQQNEKIITNTQNESRTPSKTHHIGTRSG